MPVDLRIAESLGARNTAEYRGRLVLPFRFDSSGGPYSVPMLLAKPEMKRCLEAIQLVLTFVSVCAVVDASRIHAAPAETAGYYASGPQRGSVQRDRLARDLARSERKRREAQLQEALQQRQLRA